MSARRRVLVTGAAGRIGRVFAEAVADRYDLRLMVRSTDPDVDVLRPWGEVVEGELADADGLKRLCDGVDTMVHLAGNPDPAAVWPALLETNIVGTYNAFAAARAAGVRRVIYASSIHAVGGYPVDYQVHSADPVNPGDLYGVTKCFGEALGRYLAEQEKVSVVCLRIGAFGPPESMVGDAGLSLGDAWVSPRDLTQLIVRCIEAEPLRFAIFHGVSDNRYKKLDITDARQQVGYAPQDDVTRVQAELAPLDLPGHTNHHSGVADTGKSGMVGEVG